MITPFLIADDSIGKANFLARLVDSSPLDTEIFIAPTTEEAIALINAKPHVAHAFIDYQIPSQMGPAIIKYLHQANPVARIALVTAFDGDPYKQEGFDAGAEAFICTSNAEDTVARQLNSLLLEWAQE